MRFESYGKKSEDRALGREPEISVFSTGGKKNRLPFMRIRNYSIGRSACLFLPLRIREDTKGRKNKTYLVSITYEIKLKL